MAAGSSCLSQRFTVSISVQMCDACLDNPQNDPFGFPTVRFWVDFKKFIGNAVSPHKEISLAGKAAYKQKNGTYPETALNSLQERVSIAMGELLIAKGGDIRKTSKLLTSKEMQSNDYPLENILFDQVSS